MQAITKAEAVTSSDLAQDMDFSSGWLSGRWSPLELYTCSL